ncbi:hypothetical protein GWK47_042085 [Chionoecetes opilio]|uniref:Tesmin/TSO1-like CXC domain-containing protein n=1 Tax=Chionoecetes opilio TaxID=41210 RepID=A0A8J4YIG8_CHIOP|nr:hypothetical protein GWK47_042085 [Chionoecetes opilio]
MSNARLSAWAAKTGKGYTSTPKLCSLPPTSETFEENVKRAHHQASIWRAVKDADPPELDVEKYGWKKDETNRSLVPTTVPDTVSLAPDAVLRLIRCGCESDTPCRSSRCGCRSADLSCTMFCACHDGICCNTNAFEVTIAGVRPSSPQHTRLGTLMNTRAEHVLASCWEAGDEAEALWVTQPFFGVQCWSDPRETGEGGGPCWGCRGDGGGMNANETLRKSSALGGDPELRDYLFCTESIVDNIKKSISN